MDKRLAPDQSPYVFSRTTDTIDNPILHKRNSTNGHETTPKFSPPFISCKICNRKHAKCSATKTNMRKNSIRRQPLYSGQTGCPQYVRCSECFHCIHFNHLQDLQQVWGLDVISKVRIVLFIVGFRYYYFVYSNKMSERDKGWFTYDNTLSFPLVPYLTVILELFTIIVCYRTTSTHTINSRHPSFKMLTQRWSHTPKYLKQFIFLFIYFF